VSKSLLKDFERGVQREGERRELKKTRNYDKRNRQTTKPRQRAWQAADFDEDTIIQDEPIMPRDERERRQVVAFKAQHSADNVGAAEEAQHDSPVPNDESSTMLRGRVLEISTALSRIETPQGILKCGLRGSLSQKDTGFQNVITVGDWVMVESDGNGGGLVSSVLPRRNQLARSDTWYRHRMQLIAANLDQLLIVAAWQEPQLWSAFIDRCLITAERFDITPIICINKIDLAARYRQIDDYRLPYEALGYRVLLTSTVNGRGLDELKTLLAGRVTALTGLSGVGKSSLLTTLQPDFELKTAEVSENSGEGRHTTTQAVMLPFGDGYVIDTPGVREFGLAGLSQQEIIGYYPDLQPYAAQCRFRDCTHFHEPDCAMRAAAELGQLPLWRYEDYQDLYMSLG
jgi:ribosome biogenesis GTPase / thiamine phosphate phosphatase